MTITYRIRVASTDDALQICDMMTAHALHEGYQLVIDKQLNALKNVDLSFLHLFVVENNRTTELFCFMSLTTHYGG
ncbi:hypothetical protein AADZ91_16060 [Colwelliaceae bacterium 6441]